MIRRMLAPLSVLLLIAAACGNDSSLDDLAGDLTSLAEEPTDPAADDDPAETAVDEDPAADDEPAETAALSDDERAVIDVLSQGASVPYAEARCLLDEMSDQSIDPNEVIDGTLKTEDDALVSDLILTCFENPEMLAGFVQNFAAGFSLTAGFDLSIAQASCLVAALGDGDVSIVDIEGDELPPALQAELNACIDSGLFEAGDTYGDNAVLDLVWDECSSGIMSSCDELYRTSEIGSGYEIFGATCGERESDAAGGTCDTPFDYGDNSELDSYWGACELGDGAACDQLYFESPVGSAYEDFGDTCGNRFEESPGFCEDALG